MLNISRFGAVLDHAKRTAKIFAALAASVPAAHVAVDVLEDTTIAKDLLASQPLSKSAYRP